VADPHRSGVPETSDATVVRTAKALGFSGLDELRRALADEIRTALSPADRLTRTLGEVGTRSLFIRRCLGWIWALPDLYERYGHRWCLK
jgi:hypothetical protein